MLGFFIVVTRTLKKEFFVFIFHSSLKERKKERKKKERKKKEKDEGKKEGRKEELGQELTFLVAQTFAFLLSYEPS